MVSFPANSHPGNVSLGWMPSTKQPGSKRLFQDGVMCALIWYSAFPWPTIQRRGYCLCRGCCSYGFQNDIRFHPSSSAVTLSVEACSLVQSNGTSKKPLISVLKNMLVVSKGNTWLGRSEYSAPAADWGVKVLAPPLRPGVQTYHGASRLLKPWGHSGGSHLP